MNSFASVFGQKDEDQDLAGMMLVAMPGMSDERFAKSVVFLCSYNEQGAMGLIINQVKEDITFNRVIENMNLRANEDIGHIPVYYGGPVETGRGFVLHSTDYTHEHSLIIDDRFALTATVEVLEAISLGKGPEQMIFALGYAGWSPGQLDQEIQASGWLLAPADDLVVFAMDDEAKWAGALAKLGVEPSSISSVAGRA